MSRSTRRLTITGQGTSLRMRLVGDWDEDPLGGIREARSAERALDKVLDDQVRRAREAGCSWTEVGEALATTKQAAWERFSAEP
jgi:uncharacterized NAD(P)/FAD-binding protein YdhS